MAGISAISYCENQDILDIYPRISQYDHKVKLYNFLHEGRGNDYVTHNTGLVERLFKDGKDLGRPKTILSHVVDNDDWIYYSEEDKLIIYLDVTDAGIVNPNNSIFEGGENYDAILLRFRRKASRLIESFLGSTISREIIKDREGNYPTSIIQATALKSIILFISSYNPNDPDLIPLNEEYDDIMGKIKAGKIVMTGHRSKNDSGGKIRIVTEDSDIVRNEVHPVQLSGSYKGSDYELLKVKINGSLLADTDVEREDATGELFYSVWGKSKTKLKEKLLVNNKLVSGDFQTLGVSDLYIRWGFSEWNATSGYVHSTPPGIGIKLAEGEQGTSGFSIDPAITDAGSTIAYTGTGGEDIQDLYDEGLLPNITAISTGSFSAILHPVLLMWIGSLSTLYQTDAYGQDGYLSYSVTTSAAQDEIMYKDGLPVWSNYFSAIEYEVELWGNNIQPTVSQINSTTLSRSGLWQ